MSKPDKPIDDREIHENWIRHAAVNLSIKYAADKKNNIDTVLRNAARIEKYILNKSKGKLVRIK